MRFIITVIIYKNLNILYIGKINRRTQIWTIKKTTNA
uniref:Uncharacterized protein n=1 Tax=Podoviridae sp. ctsUe5 TaxID=2827750 RepID=A0A8S5S5N0_9CAUD|nr:MAG TPA: hypothetical protein [Podoviridae sp. ctsUe5]